MIRMIRGQSDSRDSRVVTAESGALWMQHLTSRPATDPVHWSASPQVKPLAKPSLWRFASQLRRCDSLKGTSLLHLDSELGSPRRSEPRFTHRVAGRLWQGCWLLYQPPSRHRTVCRGQVSPKIDKVTKEMSTRTRKIKGSALSPLPSGSPEVSGQESRHRR